MRTSKKPVEVQVRAPAKAGAGATAVRGHAQSEQRTKQIGVWLGILLFVSLTWKSTDGLGHCGFNTVG